MSEIKWTITPDDIEWEMDWTGVDRDGNRRHPDKPDKTMEFEQEPALALLLLNEVIYINDHWWKKDWPDYAQKTTSLNVNCNDVFAWGTSDGEEAHVSDLENIYRMWRKDPIWGAAVWCMVKRNEMPQRPVYDRIKKAGIWDLDALGLGENTTQEKVTAMFRALAGKLKAES